MRATPALRTGRNNDEDSDCGDETHARIPPPSHPPTHTHTHTRTHTPKANKTNNNDECIDFVQNEEDDDKGKGLADNMKDVIVMIMAVSVT